MMARWILSGMAMCAMLVAQGPSVAALEVGAEPKPRQVRPAPAPTAKLRHGLVTAVNLGGNRVEIGGVWYAVTGRTQWVRGGRPAGIDALKKGQSLSFTVLEQVAGPATLGVVHVPN